MNAEFRLRPVAEADMGFCYFLAVETEPVWRRVCSGGLPLPVRFGERLWRDVFAQYLIVDINGKPLGVGAIYEVDERNRTCSVDVAVLPVHALPQRYRSDPEGWTFSRLFERAFATCGFRKAYVRYLAWQPPAIEARWQSRREALLTNHLYHDGAYWDEVWLAVDNQRVDL